MRKTIWAALFFICLAVNLFGISLNDQSLQNASKPFLIIILMIYFFSQTRIGENKLKKWILIALFFSWAGDILLIFQHKNELFFLLGLSAFLSAHIFYIIFFNAIRVNENIKNSWVLFLIVVVYYAVLIFILFPHLGKMRLPVMVYGIVISLMFMLAMHMLFSKNKIAGKWMMIGALLFVLSDSMLAINKFYNSFEIAGILVMTTYGLAQFLIIEGATLYIRTVKST